MDLLIKAEHPKRYVHPRAFYMGVFPGVGYGVYLALSKKSVGSAQATLMLAVNSQVDLTGPLQNCSKVNKLYII